MPTREDQRKIALVMERFDFKKVREVMKMMKWKWALFPRPKVPSIVNLKDTALRLLEDCTGSGYCATGGLVAEKRDGIFSLSFVIEDNDSMVDADYEEPEETHLERI